MHAQNTSDYLEFELSLHTSLILLITSPHHFRSKRCLRDITCMEDSCSCSLVFCRNPIQFSEAVCRLWNLM